jgi:hypothetical protein
MIRHLHRAVLIATTALALALPTAALAAPAQDANNQVAVATKDQLVAVTFFAPSTPRGLADAGAFATTMINQYHMVPIASFAPDMQYDSILVCGSPLNRTEAIGVYAIATDAGLTEAAIVCASIQNAGMDIIWAD